MWYDMIRTACTTRLLSTAQQNQKTCKLDQKVREKEKKKPRSLSVLTDWNHRRRRSTSNRLAGTAWRVCDGYACLPIILPIVKVHFFVLLSAFIFFSLLPTNKREAAHEFLWNVSHHRCYWRHVLNVCSWWWFNWIIF